MNIKSKFTPMLGVVLAIGLAGVGTDSLKGEAVVDNSGKNLATVRTILRAQNPSGISYVSFPMVEKLETDRKFVRSPGERAHPQNQIMKNRSF
ncbi:MAG: hypothetical protein H0W49_09255 [Nitrospirales bacterium]|nr:hypothetical protein [Nitrospirales bacterium]